MSASSVRTDTGRPDRGSILPLTLVATVVIAIVVVAIATYVATDLRYGQVVEARAGRLAAAHAAMDDALEQLEVGNPICSTAGPTGVDTPFPEVVNGASVVVNCRAVGTTLPPPEGWAMVITGEGAPPDSSLLLEVDNSQPREIGGPVYLQQPLRTDLKDDVLIVGGDLWYPDAACAETDPSNPGIQYQPSSLSIPNLEFETTRGSVCINRSWDALFGTGPVISPMVATLEGLPPASHNPAHLDVGGCRVFDPGYYTALPLTNNNYFKSGVYIFDGVGLVDLHGDKLTMGNTTRQGYPAVENAPCDAPRAADATTGATLYTKGNTRFNSGANSGFEISGSQQGQGVVALHVLNSSVAFGTAFVGADNGNHKEAAFHGLVWAPRSSFIFDTTPTTNASMLRGGAVIASFRGKVPASSSGFIIEVSTSEAQARLVLDSTATDGEGTNIVRAVVDYRPSAPDLAVLSRRVVK